MVIMKELRTINRFWTPSLVTLRDSHNEIPRHQNSQGGVSGETYLAESALMWTLNEAFN